MQPVPLFNSFARQEPPLPDCTWAGAPCNLNTTILCQDQDQAHTCICSTTSYLLGAACDYCTHPEPDHKIISWEKYRNEGNNSCDQIPFPPLPPNRTLPSWVQLYEAQVPSPTTFNQSLAQSLAEHPPSSTSSSSSRETSTTSTSPTSESTTVETGPPPPPGITPTSSSSPLTNSGAVRATSNVGPIAGGIIGGVIFLALAGLLIWYTTVRRRRHHIAPSAAYKAAVRAGTPMPYQAVRHDSPKNSMSYQTDDLTSDRAASPWVPSDTVKSEKHPSRFLEHT
ncbi:hypothetical protein C8J57DRAFT_1317512 [Mycena rebaudengoi]|nr:hypothetical protein C8J57DRAFT_1317512 [Mycena rebaudengoi]